MKNPCITCEKEYWSAGRGCSICDFCEERKKYEGEKSMLDCEKCQVSDLGHCDYCEYAKEIKEVEERMKVGL